MAILPSFNSERLTSFFALLTPFQFYKISTIDVLISNTTTTNTTPPAAATIKRNK